MIREVNKSDAAGICEIYNYYIKNSVITFEEDDVDEKEVIRRIEEVTLKYPWFVCDEKGIVTGYAYAAKWKERSAYRYSAETTVYVHKDHYGKGIGSKLMLNLIDDVEKKNIHYLVAGIVLPNQASIALHEKMGFKKCGLLKEVGFKFGKWIDVGYWEKIL